MATNAERIWAFLMGKIGNAYGVAGLMGNLNAESALEPKNLQNSYEKKLGYTDESYTAAVDSGAYTNFAKDSAGYGLAQWTYHTRKAALLAFARAAGASVGDLDTQLNFLWKELSEGYKTSVLAVLKTATNCRTASDAVLTKFERPADMGEAVKAKRAGYAQMYYTQFANTTIPNNNKKEETTMGCTASKLLAVAAAEIGYKEKETNSQLDNPTANAGDGNYTKYARDFDQKYPNWYNGKKNGYAWCDMFVDWCFLTAFGYEKALELLCQPEKSAGAGCTYSARYYRNKGQFYTSGPKPGDQIFFGSSVSDCSHTGIVEKVDSSKVYTIEGNTFNMVARRSYTLNSSKIVGYGRPKYDSAESTAAPVEPKEQYTVHTVEEGETLTSIAKKYGMTSQDLISCNPDLLSPGQKIKVPGVYEAYEPEVGDIVMFTGCQHFASANATNGPGCKGGKAKITSIFQPQKSKHPYHLIAVSGGGSTVYGWVDRDSFTKV